MPLSGWKGDTLYTVWSTLYTTHTPINVKTLRALKIAVSAGTCIVDILSTQLQLQKERKATSDNVHITTYVRSSPTPLTTYPQDQPTKDTPRYFFLS
jgi:hypothetical protein